MLRLILGRTRSGKTSTIIEEIKQQLRRKNQTVYFFVPEQQLFSMEQELLSSLPPDEAKYLTLTTFTKFCDTIEDTYGGRSHITLSAASSSLIMWFNLRSLAGLLETYHTIPSGDVPLTRMMLETAKELSGSGISPQKLEDLSSVLPKDAPLAGKLKDLSLILSSYARLTEDVCGNDPADRLLRAAELIEKHKYFQDSLIYIDSFTSFTSQEYTLISQMLIQAEELVLTLGIDHPLCQEPQFDSLKDTYRHMGGLCSSLGIERYVTRLSNTSHEDELSLLEAALWDFSANPSSPPLDQGHIHMTTSPDPYEEAEAAALHILALAEMGIPYEEIAVVVRNMDQWRGILDATLEQYHIPFFLSEKTDLNTKPVARLLIQALRCISRHYQIHDIISLCKSGLCTISPRELDYFEEYTETWHLTGNRMTENAWNMNPDGYTTDWTKRGKIILEAANQVRERVMTPLLTLEFKLKAATTLTDQCKAIYEYLCELTVRQQLSSQGQAFLALGQMREAGETVRLWSFINEALATLSSVSISVTESDPPLSAEELSSALSLIYTETDIGSVPAGHDCVMIGTADTFRVNHIRASLLLGLCEGEFPKAVTGGGLLSSQDKEVLACHGLELNSREALMISEELLYVYRAMTKPTEHLYLSYSLMGTDGRNLSPSVAFTRVSYLFPYIKIIPFTTRYMEEEKNAAFRPAVDDRLSQPRVYALMGEETWLSRSKLQRYAHCPYSYFGSYVLKLREKINAKVDNLISGLFLHHVLETFLRNALDKDGQLRAMTDEELQRTAEEIMTAYIGSLNSAPDLCRQGRFLHTFDRLRAIALVLLKDMMTELFQGSFLPVGFEWDTHGYTPEDPLPMVLPLYETPDDGELPVGITKGSSVKLKMGGVIDRVDVYRTKDGKTAYIRVVDYKSSSHELSEKTITEDMDIQLLLYLFTLCSPENRRLFVDERGQVPENVLPAQAMYLSPKEDTDSGDISAVRSGLLLANDDVVRAASHELDPDYLPKGIKIGKDGTLSGKALCSEERMAALEALLHETIRKQADAMYSGIAYRTSSPNGCQYCAMRESCPIAADKPSI